MPVDVVRANGMISATNLVVRERFGPGPTIALNAHGDVVPPGLGSSTSSSMTGMSASPSGSPRPCMVGAPVTSEVEIRSWLK